MTDTEFLEGMVKGLVDNPKDVEVKRTVDEMGVLMSLKVNEYDMGRVIGKTGTTIAAIRTLTRVFGMKDRLDMKRINIKLIDQRQEEKVDPDTH